MPGTEQARSTISVHRATARWRRGLRRSVTAAITVLMLLAAPAVATGLPPQRLGQQPPDGPKPFRVVVLVDESGSLSPDDVRRETHAAQLIVAGALSPQSTVTVIGFGSADASGQPAIDPVCGTGRALSVERQSIVDCIGTRIQRRDPDRGDGTDHVSALREARNYLGTGDEPKIVFLLTDGRLDVRGSTNYRGTGEEQNAAARAQLPGVLAELRDAGAQVWPLGFGTELDETQLRDFARGGAQSTCRGDQGPRPTIVSSSAELLEATRLAYQSAGCLDGSQAEGGLVEPGATLDLTVDISPIATDGSIIVFKGASNVQATFTDPDGTSVPKNGELGESRFEISTDDTGVESLRIFAPKPGTWKITLAVPADGQRQEVAATAIFQAAVSAVLLVDPLRPRPGAPVEVTLRLFSRLGNIDDADLLTGLTFSAELSGEGFADLPIPLADDDRDGLYAGRVTVPPSASGTLTVTGSVGGRGVDGDTRTVTTSILPEQPAVEAQPQFLERASTVAPGAAVPAEVVVTNNGTGPTTLRLEVVDAAPGTLVYPDPRELVVDQTGQSRHPFTLNFSPDTVLGSNAATLRVVDAGGDVLDQLAIDQDVAPPPTVLERFLPLWIFLALAVLGVVGWLVARARRVDRRRRVDGLSIEQFTGGNSVRPLRARSGSKQFRFVLRGSGDDFFGPTVEHATATDRDVFVITRNSDGSVTATTPDADTVTLRPGESWQIGRHHDEPITVLIQDRRATGPARPDPGPQPAYPGAADDPLL